MIDFTKDSFHGGVKHLTEYLPFAVLAVVRLNAVAGRPGLPSNPSVEKLPLSTLLCESEGNWLRTQLSRAGSAPKPSRPARPRSRPVSLPTPLATASKQRGPRGRLRLEHIPVELDRLCDRREGGGKQSSSRAADCVSLHRPCGAFHNDATDSARTKHAVTSFGSGTSLPALHGARARRSQSATESAGPWNRPASA